MGSDVTTSRKPATFPIILNWLDIFLKHNSANRPAARFNRLGQNALYLSVDEKSARVAVQKYVKDSDPPRVLIRYEIETCQLFDLRHSTATAMRELASHDWKRELLNGAEPSSWQVADKLRENNEVGLIDPSRKNPNTWHITPLNWNRAGAPKVTMVGPPKELTM